ncbi:MAG: 16S rRNA (cytosine(1402)-N(4))-methyltransferase RsmH [Victivallaceae bacterium]|nr:16S rRNA (cytosine(1402)-N(4))-methyltransferase RsmH [Victivallaceae bacterium]
MISPDCSAEYWGKNNVAGAFEHIPVLIEEVVSLLRFKPDAPARLIDGTIGGGGHSARLLELYPQLELLGIDRDQAALDAAAERLKFAGDRVTLVRGNYSELADAAQKHGWGDGVDGILLDIGVSSPQFDTPERGFSWRADGPLDMRMDRRSQLTASRVLNRESEAELCRIFRDYGEIPQARRLAAAVVARREAKPFATTSDFTAICDEVLGHGRPDRHHLPAPTLPFQALRIAVNDELGELERALPAALRTLRKGGRLAVISFHSLEDRIVKNFLKHEYAECVCPPGLPICICGKKRTVEILTRKALTAQDAELAVNKRSACAKLRAAEKTV